MAYETLSQRGRVTAGTSMRKILSPILSDTYHPETNPSGFVNMGTAENYAMTPDVSAFTNEKLRTTPFTFTYGNGGWGSGRLREAMAAHMTRHFHPVVPISPDDILFSAGITTMCELLGFTIAEHGEGILFPRPTYQAFETDFGAKAGIKCVYTAFHGSDQFATSCVEHYEQALQQAEKDGIKVRALLLCNPHNPLGKCYPKSTLVALMRLCNRHRIHLLADEIYALSVYDIEDPSAEPFTSVLSFDSSQHIDPDLLHVLYGFSKDFASGGLRLGCIYTRNAALMEAVSAIVHLSWPSVINEVIGTAMLEDQVWLDAFFAKSRTVLAEKNLLVRRMLDDKGIEYLKGSNAGFFIWMDLRPWLPSTTEDGVDIADEWDREVELARRMARKKVYFTDGKGQKAEEPGWFRVIFTQEDTTVQEGLRRLFELLGV